MIIEQAVWIRYNTDAPADAGSSSTAVQAYRGRSPKIRALSARQSDQFNIFDLWFLGPLLPANASRHSGICAALRGEDVMSMIHIRIPIWLDRIFAWPAMVYRKWKYGYAYRKIYLDEGKWTILDPQDYCRLGCFRWNVTGDNECLYAARIHKKTEAGRIKTTYLHREIINAPKGLLVDHRNGIGLDNRRANLRLATHSQNA
jgi:hypothetical protein